MVPGSMGCESRRRRGRLTLKASSRGAPIFWQTFRIAVGFTVCALLAHFIFILVLRPAPPPTYSLDAITSVLGSGMAIRDLDVQLGAAPSPSQPDDCERALSLALADRLGVESSAVRVVLAKPSRLDGRDSSDVAQRLRAIDERRNSVSVMGEMPDEIVGDFTAALRLNHGQWRVIRPTRSRHRAIPAGVGYQCMRELPRGRHAPGWMSAR